ncbi:MAG: hypothetical protein NTU63_02045 [Candidatus Pacearchaeota archaeon]|nr:hypothetical protein [Candidatus Pacearchaeota archaeon]
MAKIRTTSYDLTCYAGEYEDLIKALSEIAISHGTEDKWQYFLMPKGKIKISLLDNRYGRNTRGELEGRVRMAIQRTTFKEPRYVRRILKRLEGESNADGSFTENGIIQLHLKENHEEYKEDQERYRKREFNNERK